MTTQHTPETIITKAKVYEFERASERPYYISCCAPTITKFVDLDDYKALEMNHDALMQQRDDLLGKLETERDSAIALLAALKRLEVSANTVIYCYGNACNSFISVLRDLKNDAANAREAIAKSQGDKT